MTQVTVVMPSQVLLFSHPSSREKTQLPIDIASGQCLNAIQMINTFYSVVVHFNVVAVACYHISSNKEILLRGFIF